MNPSDDLVKQLASTFIARRDVKAVQSDNGAYHPVRERWSMQDLRDHISGKRSLGHYTVDENGNTKLFAFDIDLDSYGTWGDGPPCNRPACQKPHIPEHNIHPREVWKSREGELFVTYKKQFRALGEGLASRAARLLDLRTAIAYSGSKGIHVYGFTGEHQADDVREAALELLRTHTYQAIRGENFWKHEFHFPHMTVEVFPKQSTVRNGDGLGNLMRLPLGRNLKGGNAFFLDASAAEGVFAALDPGVALTAGAFPKVESRG
jgi:hypothetical protein